METKFSKGEWWSCCLDAKPHFVFAGEGEKTVCVICSNDKDEDKYEPMMEEVTIEEARANARLIQSAPEMLESHLENEGICDMILNAFNRNDINTMMKLAMQIKSNCVTVTLKATE